MHLLSAVDNRAYDHVIAKGVAGLVVIPGALS
jgi:hypothetical protein